MAYGNNSYGGGSGAARVITSLVNISGGASGVATSAGNIVITVTLVGTSVGVASGSVNVTFPETLSGVSAGGSSASGAVYFTTYSPAVFGAPESFVRVAVYESDATTLISYLPRRRNVKWQDEMNTPGTGQFDVFLDDEVVQAHPDIFDDFNVVKFSIGNKTIKAWVIEDVSAVRVSSDGNAGRWATVSGRGLLSVLEHAVIYPEHGMNELVKEDRYFNFASADGVWRVPSEWQAPVGTRWSNITTAREGYPKNWPDPKAEWLWSSDPELTAPPGHNWFRSTITLDETTDVIIYATADNLFVGYLDGEVILSSGHLKKSWRKSFVWRTTLAAGDHVFAANVVNYAQAVGGNPGALIATMYRTDGTGDRTASNLWRTTHVNTLVKAYGTHPGWSGAAILQQLILEAQDRGVTALLPMTFDFSGQVDSSSTPWTDKQSRSAKVGTTDLADLAVQVIELSLDLDIDPDFVMHAWKKRGADLSPYVILRENRDITSSTGKRNSSRIRNQALAKFDGGWIEVFSATSKDTYGRREVGLSIGTTTSSTQATLATTVALQEVVEPETTIPVSYTSAFGPQPYVDFGLGDTITTPDFVAGMTKARCMSITGSEVGEGGVVQWDLEFYPEVDDTDFTTIVTAIGESFDDASTLYQEEVLSDSPWGYWRLQESSGSQFSDISGRSVGMTLLWPTGHKPTLAQAGPVALAVSFDNSTGSSGGLFNMAYATTLTGSTVGGGLGSTFVPGKKSFNYKYATFEAWVMRLSNPPGRMPVLMAYDYNNNDEIWHLGVNSSGNAYFQYLDRDGMTHVLISSSALSSTKFTHVVGSLGANGQKLYINGVLDQHATSSLGTVKTAGYEVTLRADTDGDTCNVVIAEPAVYFQQLTNSRVAAHFSAAEYTP